MTHDANSPYNAANHEGIAPDVQTALDLKIEASAMQAAIDALSAVYQVILVSGTNIKTLNGTSLLGSGNIVVTGYSLPTQTGNSGKFLTTNGTAESWGAVPIAGVSGLGANVGTALAIAVGSSGGPVTNGGALGTPSSGTVTNLTGTASININGTVGATTRNTLQATTGNFSGDVDVFGAGPYVQYRVGVSSARQIGTTWDNNLSEGQIQTASYGFPIKFNAGSIAIASGNGNGSVSMGGVCRLGIYTVATLPSASSNAYYEANVSDSLSPTIGSTVASGGSAKAKVWSNGTNWIVVGK